MRSVEQQIQSLAEAAEAAIQPIVFRPPFKTRPWGRYALIAVVCLVVGAGGLLLAARGRPTTMAPSKPGQPEIVIANPLEIDLEQLAVRSEGLRVSSMGEVLTFDFDALPEEWSVDEVLVGTSEGLDGASYHQGGEVVLPEGIHLFVNVEGFLDGSEIELWPLDYAEATEVRGQPAQTTISMLEWIEQGIARVSIYGSSARSVDAERVLLSETLQPIRQHLNWHQEIEPGPPVDHQIEPVLAGTLSELTWEIIPTGTATDLFALVIDGAEQGRTPYSIPADPAAVEIDITSLPGGIVVLGHAPPQATRLLLHTRSGTADLPVVIHQSGRNVFAVPLEDVIDPLRLEFLDDEGQTLGAFPLDQYPPYLSGSIGTGLKLTID